jgi:hypothetical protein
MTNPTFVEDYNAIVDVLNKYNRGCAEADSSIMKPAFSEQATIFGIETGKLFGGAIEGLFETIDTAFRPSPEAKAAIVRIDIVGTAASARPIPTTSPVPLHRLSSQGRRQGTVVARFITPIRAWSRQSRIAHGECQWAAAKVVDRDLNDPSPDRSSFTGLALRR